jgi:uncharacterized protein YndB with AHSA1/START domain
MTTRRKPTTGAGAPRRKITIERTFRAPLEDVWDLWTTKEGIESWWGPEGFVTKVRRLEVLPGGKFEYAMTATGPAQVEAMKAADLPMTSVARGTYTDVSPRHHLGYKTVADFIPGVAPYEVTTAVEFHEGAKGVRMVVTQDAMHDAQWTEMARMGLDQQFQKLAKVLGGTPN